MKDRIPKVRGKHCRLKFSHSFDAPVVTAFVRKGFKANSARYLANKGLIAFPVGTAAAMVVLEKRGCQCGINLQ